MPDRVGVTGELPQPGATNEGTYNSARDDIAVPHPASPAGSDAGPRVGDRIHHR